MRRFGRRLDVERLRRSCRLRRSSSTCCTSTARRSSTSRWRGGAAAAGTIARASLVRPVIVTADGAEADGVRGTRRSRAGTKASWPRRSTALYAAGRRGAGVAEGQAGAHARPRRARGRVGQRPPPRHAEQPAPRRARPERGGFVMLGKTFKGLTDEMLAWQTEKLSQLEIARDDYTVYVRPELVVEIAFNEIQESPHYPGRPGAALRARQALSARTRPRPRPTRSRPSRAIYQIGPGRAAVAISPNRSDACHALPPVRCSA